MMRTSTLIGRCSLGLNLAFLQKAQQFRLDVKRQVANLIEEKRAASSRTNDTSRVSYGAGEAAAPIAERYPSESSFGTAVQLKGTKTLERRDESA